LLALVIAGCAYDPGTERITAEEFAGVERVRLYRASDTLPPSYQSIERVEGTSCTTAPVGRIHPRDKVVTEFEALYQLRLAAARRDADMVVDVHCLRLTGGWMDACTQQIHCSGEAARAEPARSRAAGDEQSSAGFEVPFGFTPDYLTEAQRSSLGKIGVGVPEAPPGHTVELPLLAGEAASGAATNSFLNCVGQLGPAIIGVVPAIFCAAGAAIGAGFAAATAEKAENLEGMPEAIQAALGEYYSHDALRAEVVRVAHEDTGNLAGIKAIDMPSAPMSATAPVADTMLEVGVEELLLPVWARSGATNLPSPISVRARARVVRMSDARVLFNKSYRFTTEAHRFVIWGAEGAAKVRFALGRGFTQLAQEIVEDVLLVYPLMPGFGDVGRYGDSRREPYLVQPLNPPAHEYDFNGRPYPSGAGSVEPTFAWEAFPGPQAERADFQGALERLAKLRYDVRIYVVDRRQGRLRLVLERRGIEGTSYRPEQPLAPDSEYVWSVRARFELDGNQRTTRWSGDWMGRGVRGFLFYTPR
jgi:hypothetical protein